MEEITQFQKLKELFESLIKEHGVSSGMLIGLCIVLLAILMSLVLTKKAFDKTSWFVGMTEFILLITSIFLACVYYIDKWNDFRIWEIPLFLIVGMCVIYVSLWAIKNLDPQSST